MINLTSSPSPHPINSKLSIKDDKSQLLEVAILRSLNPNSFNQTARESNENGHGESYVNDNGIINIVDFYPSPKTYHIVMELARGGDVFDRLAKRKVYTEKTARDLAFRMLSSIKFLHERGIAHRDIKPENLLLMDEESDTALKLADFGFARRFSLSEPDTSMKTKCGTPSFVPPELILGVPYGPKCDIWSCGCTLFMLLSGRAPFNARGKGGKNAMFRKIRAGDFVFYEDMWAGISVNARKLVLSMMQVDPKARVTAEQALQSEWINTNDTILRKSVLGKTLKEIISFNARRKLKGAMNAVRYAISPKFWDISTTAIWRESEFDSDRALDGNCDILKETTVLDTKDPPTFEKFYTLDEKIQLGRCCVVWSGNSKENDRSYAIKVVDRTKMDQAEDETVLNEVSLLKSLRHPNVVKLCDFFETPERFYIVMQKCSGDVLDRVVSLTRYTEKEARQLSAGLIKGVQYIHERKIAHRDLKPQNLLLESSDDNTSVKICDFGFAKRVHVPQSLTTLCGSKHYVAPELLKNHPYDESADMWSVGVIIYFLLAGHVPFNAKDQQDLFQLIRLGKFGFETKYWAGISDEAMDLIERLLDVDPASRATASDALESEWIQGLDDDALIEHELRGSLDGITETRASIKGSVRQVQWINKSKKMCSSLTLDPDDFDEIVNCSSKSDAKQ
jgi:serine/threonine protein kinase